MLGFARIRGRVLGVLTLSILASLASPVAAHGQTASSDELITAGAEAYESHCAACHQSDGVGIPGAVPPLVGNDHTDDAAFLADVVANGLDATIVVNDVEYSGKMPAFASLTEQETTGIIAFIQAGLQIPAVTTTTLATPETTVATQTANQDLIDAGAAVYTARCSGCHQAGGVGLAGSFPPLLDNAHVADAAYVAETIRKGRQGEIEVGGETYNGVMPPFPNLSDGDIAALVAYIQAGFPDSSPSSAGDETAQQSAEPATPDAGTPWAGTVIIASLLLAGLAGLIVFREKIASSVQRPSLPWLDATLKAVIIVVFFVIGTAVIPSMILKSGAVSGLSRPLQDLIGSAIWLGALALGLLGLWWAHRQERI